LEYTTELATSDLHNIELSLHWLLYSSDMSLAKKDRIEVGVYLFNTPRNITCECPTSNKKPIRIPLNHLYSDLEVILIGFSCLRCRPDSLYTKVNLSRGRFSGFWFAGCLENPCYR